MHDILQYIYDYRFELVFILCVILLCLYLLFKKSIDNYLQDKNDFELPKIIKPKKIITKKYERQCRRIFENIFKKPFPSVRPQFLKRNTSGKCLELDGWNPDLNLAFEYNGVQHYKYTPKFHKNMNDFNEQVKRDNEKRQLCKLNNITLIEIPHNIKYNNLYKYILNELDKKNVSY